MVRISPDITDLLIDSILANSEYVFIKNCFELNGGIESNQIHH